ncbi:MAG: hypothetical protein OEY49_13245 [Candidatus Heimdallarchaeota archaeon]|nr:hypothetical protein [Candidatus Heimdallarchaeota archaeon]
MLFAHHPVCGYFEDDLYSLKGIKICKGCAAGYTGITIAYILNVLGIITASYLLINIRFLFYLLLVGIVITLIYELQKNKKYIPRFPIRMMMGVSFMFAIIIMRRINNIFQKIGIILLLFCIAVVIGYLRHKKMYSICRRNCYFKRYDYCEFALGIEIHPYFKKLNIIEQSE